jgi:hypothetical protein
MGLVLPSLPAIPGLPFIPGLPSIPGLSPTPSAVAPTEPGTQDPGTTAKPIALRGSDAVAAIVGARPTVAQYLLLSPVLAGGSVTVAADDEGPGK